MIVPPSFGEHLLWTGGLWVALASLWAAICMWVDRDARKVFGQALPWNLIFAAVGVLLFVATWQAGLGPLVLFALLVPAFTLGYVALRDTKAKPTDKILSATFARRTGRKLAVRLGLAAATVRVHLMKGVRDCAQFFRARGLLDPSAKTKGTP